MNDILLETPWDIKDYILDLAINVKIKELEWDNIKFGFKRIDFENILTLLKKWHNKKAVRSAIVELINQDIDDINLENSPEIKNFIVDLIKIDELGIAKIFYDLLLYWVTTTPEQILENHDFLIETCEADEILLERLVKIYNEYLLFEYYSRYDEREPILKFVIKLNKTHFLILRNLLICDDIDYSEEPAYTILHLRYISEKLIEQYTDEYKEKVYENYEKIRSALDF